MKLQNISILLLIFIVNNFFVLGQNEDNDDNTIDPSEGCINELTKYQNCLAGILTLDNKKYTTKNDIEVFSKSFDTPDCKDFINDISLNTSACIPTDSESSSATIDYVNGKIILSARLFYNLFFGKDSNNQICPLGEYITNNIENVSTINSPESITDEMKKTIAYDCNDTKCNERMGIIANITDTVNKAAELMETEENIGNIASLAIARLNELKNLKQISSKKARDNTENDFVEILLSDKYYGNYKNNKCSAIYNIDNDVKSNNQNNSAITIQKMTYSTMIIILIGVMMLI